MNNETDEQSKTMLAMRLGIPPRVLDTVSFTVLHMALSMFIRLRDLYTLEAGDFYTLLDSQDSLDRFVRVWGAAKYDDIIFGDGGQLFKKFGTAADHLIELESVPRLKQRGFDNARLVAIVRDGSRFSTVLEALDNDVPLEYALAI